MFYSHKYEVRVKLKPFIPKKVISNPNQARTDREEKAVNLNRNNEDKLNQTLRVIQGHVKSYFHSLNNEFLPGKSKIPLNVPSFNHEEIIEALKCTLSTNVTMGKNVKRFEEMFANYVGARNGVMVNSGSTANLVALSIVSNPAVKGHIKRGSEIITPAVTWSTTIFPVINIGCIPVLVDVNAETYNIDADAVERAITPKTKAIIPVHLLGNPCDMKRILEIADAHDLYVIEDACEAHGAMIDDKKVGSFGDLGTFSFFFSHHISTMEGGMVVTDKDELAELAKVLRAHGWIRELKDKEEIAKRYQKIDKRFLFINIGFNVRPTEIQGAFGMHQIKKLEQFIEIRRENAKYWTERLLKYSNYLLVPEERTGTRHVWFGYPLTVKPNAPFTKKELANFLESKGIETRPIMAGNMAEQPVMKLFKNRRVGDLENSRFIMRHSFFFGNHHGITEREREYVADCVEEFMKTHMG